jgi:hypothetical protein
VTNVGELNWVEPPAPDPDMVTASRRHLTSEYAGGVERLFWELEKRPMPDLGAVGAVVSAHEAGQPVNALNAGAALVLLQSMRLELDALESSVFDAAAASGLNFESMAAVLDLPDADAAKAREDYLRARRDMAREFAPRGPAPQTSAPPLMSREARSAAAIEAAAAAGRRADNAAIRAAEAARRRDELRRAQRESRGRGANPERAYAGASEAKVQASEAAERVAAGLLRAAAALDQCAARYEHWRGTTDDPKLRQLAEEYTGAARRYREIAGRYRDISGSYKEPSG